MFSSLVIGVPDEIIFWQGSTQFNVEVYLVDVVNIPW